MYNKVYVEITNICNMNCSFCHGHSRKVRQMSLQEFRIVLDKLKGQTKYIYYHLMGEPLTHPQLDLFIKTANERGYKSIVTTNGTLIAKCGNQLLNAGVHKVNLSVHSFENGTQNDYKEYLSQLVFFAQRAAQMGTIVVFRFWNKGLDCGKNKVAFNFLKDNISGEWAENTRGIRIRDKIHIEWGNRFEWPDINGEVKGDKFMCHALKDHFGILADGSVVPCCLDSDGIINLGNIFNEDIQSIIDCEKARKIKNGFECGEASEDLCKRCGYAQRFVD